MRSAAPVGLANDGFSALAELGVRTALDLREPVERRHDRVNFGELPVRVREVPLLDGKVEGYTPRSLPDLYEDIVRSCGARFAAAARVLAEPGTLPLLAFCSAGKDRTGLFCGVVLAAIGVDDDEIIRDYTLSAGQISAEFRATLAARALRAGESEQALAVKLGAPAELMQTVLSDLRASHGGAADYLLAHGLEPGALERIETALVAS